MKGCIFTLLLISLPINSYFAQDFSGSYILNDYVEQITLNLAENDDGSVTGTLSSEGIEYTLKGKQQANKLTGQMEGLGESLYIIA
jgi:hypothetical protein